MSPRRGELKVTRDDILAVTEKLLIETGSEEAVSIRAVAEAAGTTAPTIYRHFADKQVLLYEVCDRQFERLDVWTAAAIDGLDDPVAALRAAGRAYVEFGMAHPEPYRIMFMRRADLTPDQYEGQVLADGSAFDRLRQLVSHCVETGALRTDGPAGGDVLLLTITLWSAVHGLTSLLVAKPNFPWPDVDRQIDTTLDAVMQGLHRPRS